MVVFLFEIIQTQINMVVLLNVKYSQVYFVYYIKSGALSLKHCLCFFFKRNHFRKIEPNLCPSSSHVISFWFSCELIFQPQDFLSLSKTDFFFSPVTQVEKEKRKRAKMCKLPSLRLEKKNRPFQMKPYRLNYSIPTQGIRNINYSRTTQGLCVTSDLSNPRQLLKDFDFY